MARYDRPEKRIRRILDGTAVAGGATRRSIGAVLAMGAPIAYLAAATHPQAAPGPKQLPEFEVARIKPVDPNVRGTKWASMFIREDGWSSRLFL
jgi:hypothetical protein